MASRNYNGKDVPPPYPPPTSGWSASVPPAYLANPTGYGGWVPPTRVYPDQPLANTVNMTDVPAPHPPLNGNSEYSHGGNGGGWTKPAQSLPAGYYDPANHQAYVPPPTLRAPSGDDSKKQD